MNAQQTFFSDMDELINSDNETNGKPILSAGTRPLLQEMLERALVNRELLAAHIRALQKKLGRKFRHTQALPEEQMKCVVKHGLGALDDALLAALALNPVALAGLHDEIDECLPEAWLEPMRRDGCLLLREHGRSTPSFEHPSGGIIDSVEEPRTSP